MKLIDADYLYNWIKAAANPYGKPTLDYDTALKIMDMIDRMTDYSTELIPADHPPEVNENNSSEDVIVKVKWWDGDITYDVGYYHKKYGWSTDYNSAKAIAWFPLPEICRQKD